MTTFRRGSNHSATVAWRGPIVPAQCLAGRLLLGWTHVQLAEAARARALTIGRFEQGRIPSPSVLAALRAALEACGVELIVRADGQPGVRLNRIPPHRSKGAIRAVAAGQGTDPSPSA